MTEITDNANYPQTPMTLLDMFSEKEQRRLLLADPLRELERLLEEAYHIAGTGGYFSSRQAVFDHFLCFCLASLHLGQRMQALTQITENPAAVGYLNVITARLQLDKLQRQWESEILRPVKSDPKLLLPFTKGLLVLKAHAARWRGRPVGPANLSQKRLHPAVATPDLLGLTYMQAVVSHLGRQGTGQFFTPYEVAHTLAELTLVDVENFPADRIFRFCEPACGAGVIMLAMFEVLREHNPAILDEGRYYALAIDLDATCTMMCELNFLLYEIPMVLYFDQPPDESSGQGQLVLQRRALVQIVTGDALLLNWIDPDQRLALAAMQQEALCQRKAVVPDYQPQQQALDLELGASVPLASAKQKKVEKAEVPPAAKPVNKKTANSSETQTQPSLFDFGY